MAGSKRNKIKKILSPPQTDTPVPPPGDDDELMNDLLAELDSRNQTVQGESAIVLAEMQAKKDSDRLESIAPTQKQDSKSRHQARQARKVAARAQNYAPSDPEADARLEREAKQEEISIRRTCDELGVQLHEINPDGHCLFSAVADQLAILNILPSSQANYVTVRTAASTYIFTHPDDFLPFLPCPGGEDGVGATDNTGLMTPRQFEQYCVTIRDTGAWGGEPEILALSRAYQVPIHVVQGGVPPVVVHNPVGAPQAGNERDAKVVRISFHRRMYGLGEHYNSLRPKSGFTQVTDKIQSMLS
ncbi:cysteine proteinase [Leucogyrophana mollusca]|uniref:Cysteine proteinase n=1 Tax=Leucogyrophana mollusca TaxID=85980 RepID=A0ACB8BYQ9_9AGAM|nr:cysteine proteinase [Leucogyrophana mollusca]